MEYKKQEASEASGDPTKDSVKENEFAVQLKAKFKLDNGVMTMGKNGKLSLTFTIVGAEKNIILGAKEPVEITFKEYGKFQVDNKITVNGESFLTLDKSDLFPELTRLTSDRSDIQLEANGVKGDHGQEFTKPADQGQGT